MTDLQWVVFRGHSRAERVDVAERLACRLDAAITVAATSWPSWFVADNMPPRGSTLEWSGGF